VAPRLGDQKAALCEVIAPVGEAGLRAALGADVHVEALFKAAFMSGDDVPVAACFAVLDLHLDGHLRLSLVDVHSSHILQKLASVMLQKSAGKCHPP